MELTHDIVKFVCETRYKDLPDEVVRLSKGFVLDALGVTLAGTTEKGSRILHTYIRQMGGRAESTILGTGLRVPAPKAALGNGASGHAMDYDDTQLSTSKEGVYGLLTHPSVPVVSAIWPLERT